LRILIHVLTALLLSTTLLLSACKSSEERAEEHYQSALALLEKGDTDRAIVELRNVFQLNGGHEEARRKLAEIFLQQGNRQGAYGQYLRLAEQYPDDLETRIALAEIATETGNWDEVERHGAKAEELAPDDPRVKALSRVMAYRKAVLDDDAAARREIARQADAMMADQPDNVLLRTIVIDNAIREADYSRALTELDWMIQRDPDDPRNYKDRLKVLAQLGDKDAIEAQLREMIDRFPNDASNKATLLRFYMSEKKLDAAESFLRELVAKSAPDDPGPTLDLIRFLAQIRGIDAAKAEVEKAIAERPDPTPFKVVGAALDFEAGNRDQAIAAMESVLAEAEPSEKTRNYKVALAKMLLAEGNEVGARTRVEEVLSEDPNNTEALKMRARWLIESDDTDAAIAALRTALDQKSDDAEAMTLMAEAYSRAGSVDLAKDYLSQAVDASNHAPPETLRYARVLIGEKKYLPAEDILLAALRLQPRNTDLLIALGQLYLAMEDYGRAQNVADALRRIGGDAAVQAANGIEAERLNRQSGTEEAMSFLEKLAEGADASLASKIALIRARMGTGDIKGALQLAEELNQQNPDTEAVTVVLAAVQAANGNLDEAVALYRGLLDANPARPAIWLELSKIRQRQGDRDAAKATVEEGLAQIPDNPQLLWAKASFLEQDGDIDGAIGIYEELYEQNSASLVVANNLASLLATYRQDDASLERAWTVARRFSDIKVPAVQDTYGWISYRRGNVEEALPYLEAAAEGLPNDPLVQYHLGQAYTALNRPQDALDHFRKAVEIAGPTDQRPQIEEARTLIQSLQDNPPPPPAEN